jgi:tetratricopeptide (TPR) repeat protein
MDDIAMSNMLVAELNNLGAVRLNQGDLPGALHLFREALSYTAIHTSNGTTTATAPTTIRPLRPGKKTKNDLRVKNHPGAAEFSAVAAVAGAVPEPPQQHHVEADTTADADATSLLLLSTPFIHAKGINVIPTPTAYSPDLLINTVIVSSIVVFNLAIVCHLKGLQQGNGSAAAAQARLVKAKSLYERSQQLLADARVPSDYSLGNPVTDMIYMASLNNLAQLHYEMTRYRESKHYYDLLVDFCATIVPRIYGHDYFVATLMEQTKSNFLLNAIILQKQPSLAPAA